MKKYLLLCFALAIFVGGFAQDRIVTGRLTSKDDGGALPGVNVLVKGTTTGTVTDSDGKYSLSVPSGDVTLVFSFIGLQSQELSVGDRSVIDIQMNSDIQQLSEVVVTAAGIQREAKSLGYSVARVNADALTQKSEPDVLRSMQGKVPGLNIAGSGGVAGSATRITIRGVNSFTGSNQPLFVVDGIPYDNTQFNTSNQRDNGAAVASRIADLDPNNILSMNVLKGAAAAALYGTRAANGVIVITTKSGSAKSSKKGLEVALNSSYSVEQVANLPDYQDKYGPGSRNTYANANGTWGPAFALRDSIPMWDGYVEAFPALYAGKNVAYKAIPNNVEDFFKNGAVVENSITLSGGNEKAAITAVVSDMNQTGFIPNSSFRRTNFSVGGNTTLENGFVLGANLAYTKSAQNGPLLGNNGTSPFARLFFQPRNWPLSDYPFINPANGNSVYFFPRASGVDNPYWSVYHNLFKSDVDRIAATFNIGKDITDWLNVTYRLGYNTFNDRRNQTIDKGSASGAQALGSVTLDNIYFAELESNLVISATKDLTEDLNLRVLAGHNVNQRINDRQSITSLGIVAPGIFDVDNVGTITPNGGDYTKRRLWAVYGDFSLGYRDYAFINATVRNDISSTLPKDSRSYIYPSLSGSLIFTEAFNIKSDVLNLGKIRASISKVGRDAVPYQLFNSYNINFANNNLIGGIPNTGTPFNGQSSATVNNISFSDKLKPEFTTEYEFGGEFGFFNDKIHLDVTYYNRLSTNQIAQRAVPSASGFDFLVSNFGSIRNEGWEAGLNLIPVNTSSGLKWEIFTSFTRNVNTVETLSEGVEELSVQNLFANIGPVARPGHAYGVFKGTVASRAPDGQFLIDRATGLLIPSRTQQIIGDPNPKFLLGVTNTISFKNFTLSALLDYRHGGDMFSATTAFLLGRGTTTDTEDRDVPIIVPGVYGNPNDETAIVDLTTGTMTPNTSVVVANNLWFQAQGGGSFAINSPSEFSVFDATTIRLREIAFGYRIPKSVLSKTPFNTVNITLTGRNLWYNAPNFPKGSNFDPEVNTLGAQNAQGFDFNAAPTVKRYGVNLMLTF